MPETVAPPPPPEHGDPDPPVAAVLDAFGELLVAQRRLRGRDARHAEGLTYAQVRLLSALEEEGCRVGLLAERAGVSPATATGMLDGLEQAGMVVRVRSEEDRRAVLTRLTDAGRAARDAKRAEARAVFERALGTLGPAELAAAPRVLRVLAAAIEEL